jgi:hypothetical protein
MRGFPVHLLEPGAPGVETLLTKFRSTFEGQIYKHRIFNIGDKIAEFLYEDLVLLGRSPRITSRVSSADLVVNTLNRVTGKVGRRGDGTFGWRVPSAAPQSEEGYSVRRGPVADIQIGSEVKIMATKMLAQIDRVMTDLKNQASTYKVLNPDALRVGIVGVNFADAYTGYEGTRSFDSKSPPSREAPEVVRRVLREVAPHFDELLVLRFKATNRPPFPFSWVDEQETRDLYSSALVRISGLYERRF